MPRTKSATVVLTILLAAVLNATAWAQKSTGHWVSAWSTAVHAPLQFPGAPAPPSFENKTIRMAVRPTIGGERVRIRFSNAFGATALPITAAHIALVSEGSRIIPESDRVLKFGGNPSVTIPPGSPMLSDPVDLKFLAFAEIAVSIWVSGATAPTTHLWGQQQTYISEPGDFTAKVEIPNATTITSWYWIADLEVFASDQTSATVTLGDSITDGVGAKQGEYADWPDLLANRLAAEKGSRAMAVVNAGIGGNRVLHDGAGVSALARFDRDVLAQPGVVNLIVLEGINDIGWPHIKIKLPQDDNAPKLPPFAAEKVTAEEIIVGLRQIIERAHQHGIKAFGATLTPFEGADYFSEEGEATRQAVNQWIRTGGAFDGVFDFDAAVRDPNHPSQFREGYHSGDHLHPSATGFKAMSAVVDLSALRQASGTATKK